MPARILLSNCGRHREQNSVIIFFNSSFMTVVKQKKVFMGSKLAIMKVFAIFGNLGF